MRTLLGCLSLLLTLLPGVGRAASVDIYLSMTSYSPTAPYGYSLRIDAAEGVSVVGVNFVVVGFTSVELAYLENPGISPLDSAFVPGVLGDDRASLVINAAFGQVLATGPATQVPLATLYSPHFVWCDHPYDPSCAVTPLELHDHPDYFAGTVLAPDGTFLDYELHLLGVRHVTDPPFPAAEPTTALLAALSLLGVGVSRSLRRA